MRERVEILLEGTMYSMVPTWEAYAEIEARTGHSIRALWMRFASGEIKLSEMSAILLAGLKAGNSGQNWSEQAVMRSLFNAGTWWDQEDGIGSKLVAYLESLGWTPEQLGKIRAEIENKTAQTLSAESTP